MRETINSYISKVKSDFDTKSANKCFCTLKDANFESNKFDYNDEWHRLLYLLRYFPAYLCEYKYIYSLIARGLGVSTDFRVISIGCGCMVDYYGLVLYRNKNTSNITYYGVDVIDWGYKDTWGNVNCFFSLQSISQTPNAILEDCNIFMFPKSLSDIPDAEFDIFIQNISNCNLNKQEVIIASSCMDRGFAHDERRYRKIYEAFVAKGYVCDNYSTTRELGAWEKGSLTRIDPQFKYPDDILASILKLNENCKNYIATQNNCKGDCKDKLGRYPILNGKYLSYQINKLRKI
jgi:hypothetical protein